MYCHEKKKNGRRCAGCDLSTKIHDKPLKYETPTRLERKTGDAHLAR